MKNVHTPIFAALTLFIETEVLSTGAEVLKGAGDVFSGAGLPVSSHALGELLGWAILLVLARVVTAIKRWVAPSTTIVQQTTIAAPQSPSEPELVQNSITQI